MRYYSTLRPISIGTYPKSGAINIVNFDSRQNVAAIGRPAWGFIEYDRELPESEYASYDLTPENAAIDRKALEIKVGKLLMRNGYKGKEALALVRTMGLDELTAICE